MIFQVELNCPSDIKEIRLDFDKLSKLFLVTDLLGKFTKDEVYLKKVQALIDDKHERGCNYKT